MSPAVAVCKEAATRVLGETDEARLIARSRAGDRSAQESLVRRYQDQVYHLAFNLLGDPEDARDATQDALIAMLRSLRTFRGQAELRTWVYRLTTNVCLMERRRRTVRTRLIVDLPAELPERLGLGSDPQLTAVSREVQGAVRECLGRLPSAFRAVVVLRELESLSYDEIAQVLRVPVGTVRSRLNRGRQLLRAALLADDRVSPLYPQGGGL
ncbi:MAG TPA: sigma-70 family RNA polymerase sigma factor [Armatimonadota bacterium]|nr:sigma-70 family RNA polymerase sigma factor [Armatimonadota bacterium]